MKFMMLMMSDPQAEAGVLPDAKIIATMGAYNDSLIDAGVLRMAEGLHPTTRGTRLRLDGGKRIVTDGPFAEAKEVIAGFWMIEVDSKADAIAWVERCPIQGTTTRTARIELREVSEMSDFSAAEQLGVGSKEATITSVVKRPGPPHKKFMLMFQADARFESGAVPTPREAADMGAVIGEMAARGVLLAAEGLQPSAHGARVLFAAGGRRTVIDGPLAETRETIAGFCILHADSLAEAVAWGWRGLEVHGDGVAEVRQVFGEADFPAELVAEVPDVFEKERAFRTQTGA